MIDRRAAIPYANVVSARTAVVVAYAWSPIADVIAGTILALREGLQGPVLTIGVLTAASRLGIASAAVGVRSPIVAIALLAAGLPGLGVVLATIRFASPYSWTPRYAAIGLAVVVAYAAVLVALAWPRLRARSHEGADSSVALGALWVALPALTMMLVSTRRASGFMSLHALLTGTAPLVIGLSAAVRIALRRRWLRLVRAGLRPPWRMMPRDNTMGVHVELPRVTNFGTNSEVLVRVRELPSPFRDAASMEPMGIVSR